MSVLTHKFGIELELVSPEAQQAEHKYGIEAKILRKDGVIYAEFSKEYPDMVVIEYDPAITTPDKIYKKIRRLDGQVRRKIFL